MGPAIPYALDHPSSLFNGPRTGVDVRAPQFGNQKMITTENVQR